MRHQRLRAPVHHHDVGVHAVIDTISGEAVVICAALDRARALAVGEQHTVSPDRAHDRKVGNRAIRNVSAARRDFTAMKTRAHLAAFAALLLALTGCGSGEDVGSDTMAEVMCEQFVEERLKSPGTADFQRASSITSIGPQTWKVVAAVDSENGFGALLRSDYTCEIRYDGNDQWTLISLDL